VGAPIRVSDLFAPATIEAGIGATYVKPDFTITVSPLTYKGTIVNDDSLAASKKYIPSGEKFRSQFGLGAGATYIKSFAENISFKGKVGLFADYTTITKVDVNAEAMLNVKVNKFIAVGLGATYIYDDDTKFNIVDKNGAALNYKGARSQFANMLTVGITYQLKNYE
jgi:hypothetical protein